MENLCHHEKGTFIRKIIIGAIFNVLFFVNGQSLAQNLILDSMFTHNHRGCLVAYESGDNKFLFANKTLVSFYTTDSIFYYDMKAQKLLVKTASQNQYIELLERDNRIFFAYKNRMYEIDSVKIYEEVHLPESAQKDCIINLWIDSVEATVIYSNHFVEKVLFSKNGKSVLVAINNFGKYKSIKEIKYTSALNLTRFIFDNTKLSLTYSYNYLNTTGVLFRSNKKRKHEINLVEYFHNSPEDTNMDSRLLYQYNRKGNLIK